MKQKLLFLAVLCCMSMAVMAQTSSGSFTVGGNSGSFYPVMFSVSGVGGTSSLGKLSLYINNVHTNGSWSGSFHSDIEFIASNWNHISTKIASFTYITGNGSPYNDPIGDIKDGSTAGGSSQLVIWLRGGGTYLWSTTSDSKVSLMDANSDGTIKKSSSNQSLNILSTQTPVIVAAKNNRYLKDVGLRVDNTTYMPGTGIWDTSGNVGIGTITPQTKLNVKGDVNGLAATTGTKPSGVVARFEGSDNGVLDFGNAGGGISWIQSTDKSSLNLTYSLVLNPNGGSVGIGTTAPDQKLTVKGKIHAEEVIVDLNVPAADYVFAKDYSLMPLHKVEQYVKTNNHLPDVPSATEIKDKGLSMGEMQNKLLQKIEELTLYAIEQNKQISQQNQKLDQQNSEMIQMEKRIKELETK